MTDMDELVDHPQKFSLFQAVRLLQARALRGQRQAPRRRKSYSRAIGEDALPADENIRIRVSQSLNSQPSEIQSLKPIHAEGTPDRYELHATFMGITGVHGILPHHYTSLIMSRMRHKDFGLRDFLDLFNHRLISFFYKAWEKKHLPVTLEREGLQGVDALGSLYRRAFYSLVGLGTPGLIEQRSIPDQLFLAYAGLFLGQTRPVAGLETVLKNYFRIPVEVEQFSGRWLALQPENRSRLPGLEQPKGQFNALGQGVILGRRAWDVQSKIRLVIGPIEQRDFPRYLPDGDLSQPIREVTREYVGPGLAFDLMVKVNRNAIEPTRLLSGDGRKFQLGWNTWLKTGATSSGLAHVVFSSEGEYADSRSA
jgi:type VI secretion system protein ImpH